MNKQTENYIILKPISERFNMVVAQITDSDIRNIIISTLKDNLKQLDFSMQIDEIVTKYIEENENEILDTFKKSFTDKFKNR